MEVLEEGMGSGELVSGSQFTCVLQRQRLLTARMVGPAMTRRSDSAII